MTPSPAPYVVEDQLTFLDFLIIIAQRKKLIAMITAICIASAVAIAFLLPEQYAATVIILPPQAKRFSGHDACIASCGHRSGDRQEGQQGEQCPEFAESQ